MRFLRAVKDFRGEDNTLDLSGTDNRLNIGQNGLIKTWEKLPFPRCELFAKDERVRRKSLSKLQSWFK